MKKKRKRNNHRPTGHYCRICGERKANEKFSGKGHASHICKACQAMPLTKRNETENITKIDHIQENFFISKENLKRLKKYASDKRYPESSKYAQEALNSFYQRMDEYHGRNIIPALTEAMPYAEISDELKSEARELMGEYAVEFIAYNDFIPDDDDILEIFNTIADEFSANLNYSEPEPFDPAKEYGALYQYEPDKPFDLRMQELNERLSELDIDEGDELDEYEEEPEKLQKRLLPDSAMRAAFDEVLAEVIEEFREDGFDPPTYLDTLLAAETDRLKLRRFVSKDMDALLAIMSKPEVMYAWEHGFKRKDVRKWINQQFNRYRNDGFGYFAVILKESEKLIGQAGFFKSEIEGEGVIELGYIFDNAFWGQGYAVEATRACVVLAFSQHGVDRIHCTIRPENDTSIAVAKKLGMSEVGEFVKIYDDKEMLHLVFALDKLDTN